MPQENSKARPQDKPKKLRSGIKVKVWDHPYRRKDDIYEGRLVAAAWPKQTGGGR